uniref:Reverse transcriptase domain-containing protein n=1 Tax=Fagus sylvatica TaxID=28930 RepID=A0A2N9HWM1_FAGSY
MPANINAILVCLIPKVAKPETINQFRPIGLCNTLYKAVTKILVLRLKPLLSNLIHPCQANFIPGRKASDNVIVVQEIIHSMMKSRSKVGTMALKIDLEKAYDRLEWSFIRLTLQHFNFPSSWIDLIMSCISSSSLSVLVNGKRLESFSPSRGIQQGDPLSPYIFILCMEYLACLTQNEVTEGNWKGVKTAINGPSFTHLFFADDLILFAKAIRSNCITINRVLDTFCSASRQKVNLSKSKIFLPNYLDHSRFGFLESELGLKLSKSFGKYLGDGKLETLSLAGRFTLIQAVTMAIPTHIMQCTMLPGKICSKLDKLNRNFLWGDTAEKRKNHLLNWKTISRPKEEGGLGWLIRDGKTINFWHDHWLELGVLRNLISGPLLPNEALLKICDVWDSQGNWNLQSLSLQLPSEISKFILATPRPLIPDQADCIYWKAAKNGQFNSSLAYRLWSARNKVVMEGFIFQPTEVMKKAKSLAIDFFYSLRHKNDKPPKVETLIGWTPPPTGFVKLNTNGSVLHNPGHASSRGLLRDSNGNWIQGFSHFLGITNSLVAELWGLRDGLTLARDLHISRLVVELDAKAMIDLLKPVSRTPFVTHPYSALIDDCRCLLQTFERVVIQHAHRESNFCTDLLAKEGNNLLDSCAIVIYASPPSFVVSHLLADSLGASYPRLL